ncbi:MAG TPA: hypothetical protein VIT92_08565 [Burkholderiaceae bacterium]
MHDIDRTQLEYNPEMSGFEAEQFEFGQGEGEFGEFGQGEGEFGEFGQGEWSGEGAFSEAEEMELASELLGVTNEAELEQFLGSFIKKAASLAGKAIRSPVGQAIGGALKGVAKKAIPLAGGALGGYIGGPLGAKIGSGLASAAGQALGLEAESLEQEDREFEGARQFVRLGASTVNKTVSAAGRGNPRAVAQNAAVAAAKQFAPGLLSRGGTQCPPCPPAGRPQAAPRSQGYGGGASAPASATNGGGNGNGNGGGSRAGGRWARQGNKIVLYGA